MKRVAVTAGSPDQMPDNKIVPYEEALRAVGLEPVRVRPGDPMPPVDGLLLSGGSDVDAAMYGQSKAETTDAPDTPRDEMETRLLAQAIKAGMPVLAICRGMQLFNVHFGGTLRQHIEGHTQRGVDNAHAAEIAAGTQLAAITGTGTHRINSRHHQAVDRAGDGLTVSAVSEDGYIEGLELPGHPFAVAVQWHPEDRIHSAECDLRLFQAFAATLKS